MEILQFGGQVLCSRSQSISEGNQVRRRYLYFTIEAILIGVLAVWLVLSYVIGSILGQISQEPRTTHPTRNSLFSERKFLTTHCNALYDSSDDAEAEAKTHPGTEIKETHSLWLLL